MPIGERVFTGYKYVEKVYLKQEGFGGRRNTYLRRNPMIKINLGSNNK